MGNPTIISAITKIALIGTPNSGKTSLFNALTGLNQKVGNFSGVTVEIKRGILKLGGGKKIQLTDLPGLNSIYPGSEDEQITFEILSNPRHPDHPDKVVIVVDATQPRRGLALCTQVLDMGVPVLLAFNMSDLLTRQNIQLDLFKLTSKLGVDTAEISAKTGKGLSQLKNKLLQNTLPRNSGILKIPQGFAPVLTSIKPFLSTDNNYLALQALLSPQSFPVQMQASLMNLQKDAGLDRYAAQNLISNELLVRYDWVDEVLSEVFVQSDAGIRSVSTRLDKVLTHPVWGYLIFLFVLMMVFQAIFSWAEYPKGWIENGFSLLQSTVARILPQTWWNGLIVDGVLAGIGGILVFIPQIAFLFLFIFIMEESGYMTRVVFLMDRIMKPFGFSGRSVIPLMGGMACAIPSIMMSRNIPSRTERIITIMTTPLMSCSARIPVYTLLIAMFIPAGNIWGLNNRGLFMTGIYILGFLSALLVAWVFKIILKHRSNDILIMELPIYRLPKLKNLALHTYQKVLDFLVGAGKMIFIISIVLWFLLNFGWNKSSGGKPGLQQVDVLESSLAAGMGKLIEPVIRPLGYDWKIGISVIASFAAREVFVGTMSVIYHHEDPEEKTDETEIKAARESLIQRLHQERFEDTGKPVYTPATVLSLIIFYAFSMQCMSTLAVTQREIGFFWAAIMLLYLFVLAYAGAFISYQLLS